MKVSPPRHYNRRSLVVPPISVEKESTKTLSKDKYQSYKCRTTPTDKDSPTYEIAVPYFGDGTPEKWIQFLRLLKQVFKGQGDSTGPARFVKARQLLVGNALTSFESHVSSIDGHTETLATFQQAIMAVAKDVFPKRAAQTQKRYLRRYLRKPAEMTTKKYAARVVEINSYFKYFPWVEGSSSPPEKLADDELIDIMEFGCPPCWQKSMVMHDFDSTTATVKEFVEFCERLERTEEDHNDDPKKRSFNKDDRIPRKKRRKESSHFTPPVGKAKKSSTLYCLYHGEGNHDMENCHIIKQQVKNMKGVYRAQRTDKKKEYFKKKELNAIIDQMVEKCMALNKKSLYASSKKRKKTKEGEVDDLYASFEKASISDMSEQPKSSTKSSTSSNNSTEGSTSTISSTSMDS